MGLLWPWDHSWNWTHFSRLCWWACFSQNPELLCERRWRLDRGWITWTSGPTTPPPPPPPRDFPRSVHGSLDLELFPLHQLFFDLPHSLFVLSGDLECWWGRGGWEWLRGLRCLVKGIPDGGLVDYGSIFSPRDIKGAYIFLWLPVRAPTRSLIGFRLLHHRPPEPRSLHPRQISVGSVNAAPSIPRSSSRRGSVLSSVRGLGTSDP